MYRSLRGGSSVFRVFALAEVTFCFASVSALKQQVLLEGTVAAALNETGARNI